MVKCRYDMGSLMVCGFMWFLSIESICVLEHAQQFSHFYKKYTQELIEFPFLNDLFKLNFRLISPTGAED